MRERLRRIAGWLSERILGWKSPSLSVMGYERTFLYAWTGKLEHAKQVFDVADILSRAFDGGYKLRCTPCPTCGSELMPCARPPCWQPDDQSN